MTRIKKSKITLLVLMALAACDNSSGTTEAETIPGKNDVIPLPKISVSKVNITIYDTLKVEILSDVVGGETRYTVDGSLPSKASPIYSEKLTLLGGAREIKAMTFFGTSSSGISSQPLNLDEGWNSSINYGAIVDSRDGQSYKTVQIGAQTWFAQNLNYNDPKKTAIVVDDYDSIAVGDWCYNDEAACPTFGRLYTWTRLMALPDSCIKANCSELVSVKHKGICPTGWHIPDSLEWTELMSHAGLVNQSQDSIALMKLAALGSWSNKGTDVYGFRLLPTGGASTDLDSYTNGVRGLYFYGLFSSALLASSKTNYRSLYGLIGSVQYRNTGIYLARSQSTKAGTALFNAMSVRCIKD